MYVGIGNDGAPVGLADADGTMLQITNTIRDSIRPDVTMVTTCERVDMDGKAVILVTVQQGTARPYYLAGKGIRPEGVYVRQGSSSVPATDSAIVRMIKDTNGESFEALRSLNQALTFTTLEREFREAEIHLGEAQYKTLGLVDMDGTWCAACFIKPHLRKNKIKFPHMFLIGEAGSGKSSTLEHIMLPMFGRSKVTASGQVTNFTLMWESASSNIIPQAFDEFKPSKLDKQRLNWMYNHFRDSYDKHEGIRGRADQTTVTYELIAPIVVSGEESATAPAGAARSVLDKISLSCYTCASEGGMRLTVRS